MFVRWQIARRDVLSHLLDDKSFPETFWAVCQMTNRSQRRFKPFVRWQIVPRDVLSRLSDDKSPSEAFLGRAAPSTLRKMMIWEHLHSGVFAWKGIFMDCHADARNDGCEVTGLPRWCSQWRVWGHWIATLRSQWRVWGHWIATLTLAMTGLVHEFTKVFSRVRG